jgi:tryptophan-rich sensory protein
MKAYLVLLAALTFAIAPFFSPEFGGIPPEIYPIPQDRPPVQPAGWAFAIWGVIYLWLIVHAVWGAFKERDDLQWDAGRVALFISLAVGTFWLPVALVSPIWATVLIWIMLISAIACLSVTQYAEPDWASSWPVALYAGWLTAASFVSIGLILAGYGFLSEVPAAIVALVLALCFALYHQKKLRHWTYGIAVSWGFTGIAVANLESQMLVSVLAFIAVALVLCMTLYTQKIRAES